jgi:signal peptidase I
MRSAIGIAAAVAAAALALAGWLALAPTQLGGSASYALVAGSSMEPALERGDLAVVRRRESYRAGDVVLFGSPRLGVRVLHRIVAVEDGRFRTKGDNNSYVDGEPATPSQVVGELAFTVPGAGRVVGWARVPSHAALVVALAAALALAGGAGAGAASRRGRRRRRARTAGLALDVPRPETLRAVALVAGGLCALVALLAWTRPATRIEPLAEAYEQRGAFAVESRVAPSAVYPDGRVSTGDAVFLALVQRLRVSFDYRLATELPHDVAGTAGLDAVLADGRGWERRLELVPPRSFRGDRVSVAGALDLRELRRTVAEVARLTRADLSTYALRLEPHVAAGGTLDGRPLRATFAPALPLLLDPVRLVVDAQPAERAALLTPADVAAGTRTVPARLGIGPLGADVGTLRILAVLAALLVLGGGLALAPGGARRRDASEHEELRGRFGHLLLEAAGPLAAAENVVELGDFASLARLAERHDRLVLHASVPGGDEYVVEDGGVVYRYRTAGALPLGEWPVAAALAARG